MHVRELLEQAAPRPTQPLQMEALLRARRRTLWLRVGGALAALIAVLSPASPLPSLVSGGLQHHVVDAQRGGDDVRPVETIPSQTEVSVPAAAAAGPTAPTASPPGAAVEGHPDPVSTTGAARSVSTTGAGAEERVEPAASCSVGRKYERMECSFVATRDGGYQGEGPGWRIVIERGSETIEQTGATALRWCGQNGFIRRGDRVHLSILDSPDTRSGSPLYRPPPPPPGSAVSAGAGFACP